MSKEKRKGNGIIACIVVFVLCAALVGTAIGLTNSVLNKFSLEYTGYKYSEIRSIFLGILDKNTKKIEETIDNPFSKDDVNDFYTNIKRVLFLKDSYELNTDTIYNVVFKSGIDNGQSAIRSSAINALRAYGIDESELRPMAVGDESGDSTDAEGGSSAIMNFLYDVLQNIDSEKIKNAKDEDFNLELKDKQVAAFIDSLLKKILSEPDNSLLGELGDTLSKYDINLGEMLELNQISFFSENEMIEGAETPVVMLKVTASLRTKSTALKFFEGFANENGLPDLLKNLVSALIKTNLPEKTFVTATIGLSHDVGLKVNLNRLDDAKMNALFDLIGNIAHKDIQAEINAGFSKAAESLYKTINDTVDLATFLTHDHVITIPVFDMTLDMTINKQLEDKGLKISILDIRDIIASEPPAIDKDLDFENWYRRDKNAEEKDWIYVLNNEWEYDEVSGLWTYIGEGQYKGVVLSAQNKVKFEDELLKALSESYGLDPELTFEEVMDTFTGGNGDNNSLVNMFDADKLREVLQSESPKSVEISDRMIAAIVNSQMDKLLEETEFGEAIGLAYVSLIERDKHNLLEMGLNVDLKEIVSGAIDENEFADALSGLIPERALLKFYDVDITPGLSDDKYFEMKFGYNSLEGEAMQKIMSILETLAGFDTAQFDEVSEKVRDILDGMNSVIPVTLGQSKMVFPEIYETLAHVLNSQIEGEDIDTEELRTSIKLLLTEEDPVTPFESVKERYEAQLNNILTTDYPLKDEGGLDNLKSVLDGGDMEIKEILDSEKLSKIVCDYKGNDKNDAIKTYISEKRPEIDGNQILALVWDRVQQTLLDFSAANPVISSLELLKENSKEYVRITMQVSLSGFLGEGTDAAMQLLEKIIPASTLISVKVDITDGNEKDETEIRINNGNADTLIDLIGKLDSSNNIDSIKEEIAEAIVGAFEDLRKNVDVEIVAVDGDNAKLRLPDIFTFAAKQLLEDGETFASDDNGDGKPDFDSNVNLFRAMKIILDNGNVEEAGFKAIDAEGETNVVTELKTAYHINSDADKFDGLTNSLDGDNISEMFDLDGIKYEDPKTPIIEVKDLGGIFKDKIGEDSQFNNIVSLEISEDAQKARTIDAIVKIEDFGSLFENSGDITSILPSEFYFFVEVVIVGDDAQFVINGFEGDALNPLYYVMEKLGSPIEGTLDEQGEKITNSANDAFEQLNKNIGYEKIEENKIYLPNIFGILKTKVTALKDSEYFALDIQQALQGLYGKDEAIGKGRQGAEFNYENFVDNPIAEEKYDLKAQLATLITQQNLRVTDKQLGSFINGQKKDADGLEIVQLKILTQDNKEKDNGFLEKMDVNADTVILLTAKISLQDIVGKEFNNDNNTKMLLPEHFLVTFAFTVDGNGTFVYGDNFVLNNMDNSSLGVIYTLAKTDETKVKESIKAKATIITEIVNGTLNTPNAQIEYKAAEDDDDGIGVMEFTLHIK